MKWYSNVLTLQLTDVCKKRRREECQELGKKQRDHASPRLGKNQNAPSERSKAE